MQVIRSLGGVGLACLLATVSLVPGRAGLASTAPAPPDPSPPAATRHVGPAGAPALNDDLTDLARVRRYLRQQPDAGELVLTDGRIQARFTTDVKRHRAELRELVTRPDDIRVVRSAHSAGSLHRLLDEINFDLDELRARGVDVVAVGEDPATDSVRMVVSGSTSHARAVLRARYGDQAREIHLSAGRAEPVTVAVPGAGRAGTYLWPAGLAAALMIVVAVGAILARRRRTARHPAGTQPRL